MNARTEEALIWQYARNRSNAGVWNRLRPNPPLPRCEQYAECIFFDGEDHLALLWQEGRGVLKRCYCTLRNARLWAAHRGLPLVIEKQMGRHAGLGNLRLTSDA